LAIKLDKTQLGVTLDRAHKLARSTQDLPSEWLHRVERIEECPSKTYVAALGAALLAKATDARVNSLARAAAAGPTGYSIRSVGEFMATEATRYGYHLGATGPWPLNNSPFYRNADRIDRFTNVRADAKPYHEDLVRYLQDLNRLTEDEALLGLAAFLRRRIAYAESLAAETAGIASARGDAYAEVVQLARLFCTEDPEGGKRGQALVAALFDCVYDTVDLKRINNPRPLDVRVVQGEQIVLGAEVKQVAVLEDTGLHLAAEARRLNCDKALLVAIAVDQQPLDRDGLREQALEAHGVLVQVAETIPELFAAMTVFAPTPASAVATRFPQAYAARMQEHEVSVTGRRRWSALLEEPS
jgi:SacI restriction endonuclease